MHPEAAVAAEWATPIIGIIWAGVIVRKAGREVSIGAGAMVGALWALAWLYLMGRFDTRLWLKEALPAVSWRHILAWASAPALGAFGGMLAVQLQKAKPGTRVLAYIAAPVSLILLMMVNLLFIDAQGKHTLADGTDLTVSGPDREGTTIRLFSFDFAANKHLKAGIYDCDCDDSRPFDDVNASYFATPAAAVFDKLGPSTLCMTNAGFFSWDEQNRVGFHVAPVVQDGHARYNVMSGPNIWTFGWKMAGGIPEFKLIKGVPFNRLTSEFDTAISHVRPLVVDGNALTLKPGAGVTRLRCSRTSIGWNPGASKLYLLIVRDPDSEMASIAKWKSKSRQVGGWDMPQIQQFWMQMGVKQALVFDGGDSTQLVYSGPHGKTYIGSGRLSATLGYLNDRPVRLWVPILPIRYSTAGVMNYFYVERKR